MGTGPISSRRVSESSVDEELQMNTYPFLLLGRVLHLVLQVHDQLRLLSDLTLQFVQLVPVVSLQTHLHETRFVLFASLIDPNCSAGVTGTSRSHRTRDMTRKIENFPFVASAAVAALCANTVTDNSGFHLHT